MIDINHSIELDFSKSLRNIVAQIMHVSYSSKKQYPDVMVLTMAMRYLVAAMLRSLFPDFELVGINDGRFLLHDTCLHIAPIPSEALMQTCKRNIGDGIRPMIITTEIGLRGTELLADSIGILNQIDIMEIEQFIATSILRQSNFQRAKQISYIGKLVREYNAIIDQM